MKIKDVSAMVWDQPDGAKALIRVELSEPINLLQIEKLSEREALRRKIQKRVEAALRGLALGDR